MLSNIHHCGSVPQPIHAVSPSPHALPTIDPSLLVSPIRITVSTQSPTPYRHIIDIPPAAQSAHLTSDTTHRKLPLRRGHRPYSYTAAHTSRRPALAATRPGGLSGDASSGNPCALNIGTCTVDAARQGYGVRHHPGYWALCGDNQDTGDLCAGGCKYRVSLG